MKKCRLFSLLLALYMLLAAFYLPVSATAADEPAADTAQATAPFTVDAKAAMLVDLNTNRVIYEQNPDERVYPASLTKIMTCLLVLENGNLSDTVTVDESAFADIDGSSSTAGLMVGEQLSVENLLYFFRTPKLEIQSDTPLPWTLDGEFGGNVTDVTVENCPGAIRILVSPEASLPAQ